MKTRTYILYILSVFGLLFTSCEKDLDNTTLKVVKAPENVKVDKQVPFVCNGDNMADIAFVFNWEAADFGENISQSYYLLFDVEGVSSESPYELSAGINKLSRGVTSSELNAIMHHYNLPIETATDIQVSVLSKPMTTSTGQVSLPQAVSPTSVKIQVSSFMRTSLHIVGSMFGSHFWMGDLATMDTKAWDYANYEYAMFRDNALSVVETYTAQFRGSIPKAGEPNLYMGEFTFIESPGATSVTIGKDGNGKLKRAGGGNLKDIESDGYYTVEVNTANLTYSITPYDAVSAREYSSVSLVGAGVSASVALTKAVFNPHIWIADDVVLTENDVQFKLGDADTWAGSSFPWGKATSGSGDNISINKAGTYFVKFNDLTGHYIFYKK